MNADQVLPRTEQGPADRQAPAEFNQGKRYGDFDSTTDKVAAYGLAALVAGVVVKKLGLLALLAATAVKSGVRRTVCDGRHG